VEDVAAGVDQVELAAEVEAQQPEHVRGDLRVARDEERRRPRAGAERLELALGEELRDRRAHLPALVVDEVGEPARAPLLRELLEPRELAARERLRGDEVAHRRGAPEHAEPGLPRHGGRVLDLETEAKVGLV
jgi:hypothetical protein